MDISDNLVDDIKDLGIVVESRGLNSYSVSLTKLGESPVAEVILNVDLKNELSLLGLMMLLENADKYLAEAIIERANKKDVEVAAEAN